MNTARGMLLERKLVEANETIGNLQNELRNMQARIAELEADLVGARQSSAIADISMRANKVQPLVQCDENETLHDMFDADIDIETMYSGTAMIITDGDSALTVHLPLGYCIAKVQP